MEIIIISPKTTSWDLRKRECVIHNVFKHREPCDHTTNILCYEFLWMYDARTTYMVILLVALYSFAICWYNNPSGVAFARHIDTFNRISKRSTPSECIWFMFHRAIFNEHEAWSMVCTMIHLWYFSLIPKWIC